MLKGTYRLEAVALLFEPKPTWMLTFVSYGLVHGWAGTDHRRRDLTVALLWGTPIAMAFGLLAAVGTTVTTMGIAAIGVWFGGWLDAVIQRLTEVNNIIPLLPILIMVGTFYSRSIWLMLGLIIVLSIFGAGDQELSRDLPAGTRARPTSRPRGLRRQQHAHHLPLPDPAHPAADHSPTGHPGPGLCLPRSLAGRSGSWAIPILPTWGKIINDANTQGRPVQRILLLDSGAGRSC